MAKRKCPSCAEMVQSEAKVCRYCGRDLPAVPPTDPAVVAGGLLGIALVIGLLMVMNGAFGGPDYEDAPAANSDDWHGYTSLASFNFDCEWQGYPAPESVVAVLGLSCFDLPDYRAQVCEGHNWEICDPNAD